MCTFPGVSAVWWSQAYPAGDCNTGKPGASSRSTCTTLFPPGIRWLMGYTRDTQDTLRYSIFIGGYTRDTQDTLRYSILLEDTLH